MSNDPHRTPLITLSPRWQYSLKQLLLWTTLVAVTQGWLCRCLGEWVLV